MSSKLRSLSSFSARLGIFLLIILLIVMVVFVTNWYLTARDQAEQNFRTSEQTIDTILQQSILWIDRGMYVYDLTFEPPLREAMQIYQDEYNSTGGDIEKLNYGGVKAKIEEKLGDEYHIYLIEDGVVTHTTDAKDLGLNFNTFAPELTTKFTRIKESDQFILDRSVQGHEENVPVRLFAYQGTPDHKYLFEVSRVFIQYVPKENQAYYTDLTRILWTLNPDITSFDLYNSFNVLITNRTEISLPNTDNQTLEMISRTLKDETNSVVHDKAHNRDIVYTFMPVLQTDAPSTKWMNMASRTVYSTERLDTTLMMITLWYIGFLVITLIIALIAAFTISRYLTRPLRLMLKDIDQITAGDLAHQVRSSPHNELNRISNAINQMVGEILIHIRELRVSESRYRGLFSSSSDGILILDGLQILDANPVARELLNLEGVFAGEEISTIQVPAGSTIEQMIKEDNPQSEQGFIEQMKMFVAESGSEQFLNIRINQVKIGENYLNQVQIRDVTQQQMAYRLSAQQESLREAYRQIENILSLLPDPTFVIDMTGHVLFWNRAIEKMTRIPAHEMVGKGDYLYSIPFYGVKRPMLINIVLHPELNTGEYPQITRIGNTLYSERWLRETEPSRQYASISASPLYDSQGDLIGAIETVHGITELKNAEDALKMVNTKLNLLSSITRHDILNKVMIGRSNLFLLKDLNLTSEQRSIFARISLSLASIEEFIAFTRTYQELGIETPVWQNVHDVFIQETTRLNKGGVEVEVKISGLLIYADPLFPKVCFNLLENALRHGGTITRVQVSVEPSPGGISIIVEDDGAGVPDDEKEVIFERGYGKNTGYGLFLSREILVITGIVLRETGRSGDGARFEIVVPYGKFNEKT
jgi:PAS domain-containing protein